MKMNSLTNEKAMCGNAALKSKVHKTATGQHPDDGFNQSRTVFQLKMDDNSYVQIFEPAKNITSNSYVARHEQVAKF